MFSQEVAADTPMSSRGTRASTNAARHPRAARPWPCGASTPGENTQGDRFSEKCLKFPMFFIQKKQGLGQSALLKERFYTWPQDVPGLFF